MIVNDFKKINLNRKRNVECSDDDHFNDEDSRPSSKDGVFRLSSLKAPF